MADASNALPHSQYRLKRCEVDDEESLAARPGARHAGIASPASRSILDR